MLTGIILQLFESFYESRATKKTSSALKEDRSLTFGGVSRHTWLHHPPSSVTTRRVTERDGDLTKRERETLPSVLRQPSDLRGPRQQLAGEISSAGTYLQTLRLRQTSWVTRCKHALTDDSFFLATVRPGDKKWNEKGMFSPFFEEKRSKTVLLSLQFSRSNTDKPHSAFDLLLGQYGQTELAIDAKN